MSCFVLGSEHISVVVAGLFEYGVVSPDEDARQLGADLLIENKVSFHCNYEGRYDHEVTDPFKLFTTESPLHPVALLKAVNCYTYQSCDDPDWTDSRPFVWCELLVMAVLTRYPSLGVMVPSRYRPEGVECAYYSHPVYDAAPWGFDTVEQAHLDQYPAVTP